MTIRIRLFAWALLMASVALLVIPNAQSNPKAAKKKVKTTVAETSPAPEATPSLEPKALDILKAASSRLAAARTMKFNAVHFYESPSRQGHPLAFTTKSEVALQKPDKLRVIMSDAGPSADMITRSLSGFWRATSDLVVKASG